MKILLTNDDGYDAPNIQALYKVLSQFHEVFIIAPAKNCSGMSAAISFLKETEIKKLDDHTYAVDGTPADCTYFGLLSVLDFEPSKTSQILFVPSVILLVNSLSSKSLSFLGSKSKLNTR